MSEEEQPPEKKPLTEGQQMRLFARVWATGNKAFKKAIITKPIDPVTHRQEMRINPDILTDTSEEAAEIREALQDCKIAKALKAFEESRPQPFPGQELPLEHAVEGNKARRDERNMKFSLVACLGGSIVEQRDLKKLVSQAQP